MSPTLHALARFWWIVAAGLVAGILVALVVAGRQPAAVYTASENVLVTSPSAPYLRTVQTGAPVQSPRAKAKQPVAGATSPTDTQSLVNAANLYPLLIQSDAISRLRESLYGPARGTLTATALASSTNTYGVYHTGPLPVITVKAGAPRPAAAAKLAVDTVKAFSVWIQRRQQAAAIPASQRIAIERLGVRVRSSGGASYGLPLFAGLVVLLGFCGLAVVADRLRPRPREAVGESAPARPHRHVA
jgi:uncharacterized protein involved in exopolysaccharide biosynthesis